MEANGPWKTIKSEQVYDNNWIRITHNDVLNPSGNEGIYGVVHFKNKAIGILPLDEDYNTWIVGQHRYPLNEYSWEIPEGGGALDVDPIESAKRELKEEVGIKAEKFTLIQRMHLSNCVSDEVALLYVAQGLTFHESEPDDDEELVVKKVPFEELYQMVVRGEVTDAMALAAVTSCKVDDYRRNLIITSFSSSFSLNDFLLPALVFSNRGQHHE